MPLMQEGSETRCPVCRCRLKTALDAQLHRCVILPRVPASEYGERRPYRRPIVSGRKRPRAGFRRAP